MSDPRIAAAAAELCDRAESLGWRGPDAYDGLWWRWPRPVVGGRRRRQVVMQLHARSPVDIRRLYRRQHPLIPKALAIFATTRLRLHALTGSERHIRGARAALDVLDADTTAGQQGWGYHWDMQTRWSFYPAGSPNVVVTAFAALALAEGATALAEPRYAERARGAARWVLEELFLDGPGVFAYHPGSTSVIHNASLLGARLVWQILGDDAQAEQAARRAVAAALAAQRPDGAWPYGEGSGLGFVDSFHTGYVLDCLHHLASLDDGAPEAVARGTRYWLSRYFTAAGVAKLWPDRTHPEDAHAAGTALTTMSSLVGDGIIDQGLVERVARRLAVVNVRDGHAVYRRYRRLRTTVRYLRWADAHAAMGLANAALALAPAPAPTA